MDTSAPKFKVGDKVFYLDYQKVEMKQIVGIIAIFNEDEGWRGATIKFDRYQYQFDRKSTAPTHSWIDETRCFATKEQLLASL